MLVYESGLYHNPPDHRDEAPVMVLGSAGTQLDEQAVVVGAAKSRDRLPSFRGQAVDTHLV